MLIIVSFPYYNIVERQHFSNLTFENEARNFQI